MSHKATPDSVKFKAKYLVDEKAGCWLWTGGLDPKGYGVFHNRTIRGKKAHRYAWTVRCGPIPDGLVLDHLCRVRRCVNPDHLRLVTPYINNVENSVGFAAVHAHQTHCIHGHPLEGDNLYRGPNGKRACRTCNRRHQGAKRTRRDTQ